VNKTAQASFRELTLENEERERIARIERLRRLLRKEIKYVLK